MHKFLIAFALIWVAVSAPAQTKQNETKTVHMVVWRGCEAACQGFQRFFEDRALPVNVIVTDIAKDKSKLPEVRAQLIKERPDLVVTWGTSVSVGINKIGNRWLERSGERLRIDCAQFRRKL